MMRWLRGSDLPRTVVVLGFVSLLNDAASEMVTPLLPLLLATRLGAGPAVLGLVEGLAESLLSLLKLWSGWLADRGWSARVLVLSGYGVSNAARPLMALATGWPAVVALRSIDRLGKGIRTTPRDALISSAVADAERGRAFGFHRSMDHAGAMLGPLFAFALLATGASITQVFLLSAIPGAAVLVLIALGLAPATRPVMATPARFDWRLLPPRLRGLIVAAAGLAFCNVPETFLVLWATEAGLSALWVPLLWAVTSAIKSPVALVGGALSDRVGRLPVVLASWFARIVVLALIAIVPSGAAITCALFVAYGASLAAAEGPERALVGDAAPPDMRGRLFGVYHLASSVTALPGSLMFGCLWEGVSRPAAFLTAAALTLASALAMALVLRSTSAPRT